MDADLVRGRLEMRAVQPDEEAPVFEDLCRLVFALLLAVLITVCFFLGLFSMQRRAPPPLFLFVVAGLIWWYMSQ